MCGCGSTECDGAKSARGSNVVIHVVAAQASVTGTGTTPGVLPGGEGLIPAELVAELAKSARLLPLVRPVDVPEPRYNPSAKLADFVRCRDLVGFSYGIPLANPPHRPAPERPAAAAVDDGVERRQSHSTVAVERVLVTRSCGVPLRGLGSGFSAPGLTWVRSSGSSAGAG